MEVFLSLGSKAAIAAVALRTRGNLSRATYPPRNAPRRLAYRRAVARLRGSLRRAVGAATPL